MRSGKASPAVAACALAIGACGGAERIPDGTYESVAPAATGAGASTLVIEAGGHFRLALDGQTAVTGRYLSDGARVTFVDESGPMMCAAGLTSGTYAWRLEERQLLLEALADECPGRRAILHARPHTRS
jgi:hypothetical protein